MSACPRRSLARQRDDVANVYPAYPNGRMSGFACNGHVDQPVAALDSVRVQAISAHGFAIEIVVPVERIAARAPARAPGRRQPSRSRMRRDHSRRCARSRPTSSRRISVSPPMPFSLSSASAPLPLPLQPFSTVPVRSTPRMSRLARGGRCRNHSRQMTDGGRSITSATESFLAPDGSLGVDGWAVCAVGIAGISVYLGREKVGDAELGVPRPDVGEQYATIPMARLSGFRFRQTVPDLADGEHLVRIVVRNGLDDIRDEIKVVTFHRPGAPSRAVAEAPRTRP